MNALDEKANRAWRRALQPIVVNMLVLVSMALLGSIHEIYSGFWWASVSVAALSVASTVFVLVWTWQETHKRRFE